MKKGKLWGGLYAAALTGFTVWLALDTFVIPHVYEEAAALPAPSAAVATASPTAVPTVASAGGRSKKTTRQRTGNTSSAPVRQQMAETETASAAQVYDQDGTHIELTEYRISDTTVYVADVTLASPDALAAVLAQNAYGRNVTETPSAMAQRSGAVLAVNGDYYGARQRGYVVRNGVLYRDTVSPGQEDLMIDQNGDFHIIQEEEITAQALMEAGAAQVYSFGPALITEGQISVDPGDEVGRAMASNPRTALAQVGPLHYLFVVADGRSTASAGLDLYDLAQFLRGLGAQTAYNLDGGGSSAMIFQGQLVNNPTTNGNRTSERSVSDIVGIF